MGKAVSVIVKNMDRCYACGNPHVHIHHVFFGTANRKLSDKYGYVVPLCPRHHNMSMDGVHFNKTFDNTLKWAAQRHFEANHGTRDEFIKIFGRSYI